MEVSSENISVPVTALLYLSESCILAAKSTYLFILDHDVSCKVFKHQVIHQLDAAGGWVVVSGGRSISTVKIYENQFEIVVPEVRVSDWIVDLCIVMESQVCALLAHNAVLLMDGSLNILKTSVCEVSCIVYGGCLKNTFSTISCYSGTVFSKILYFEPFSDQGGLVQRNYSGHDGVIFDVDVTENKVFSVSDDRTLIIWDKISTSCLKKLYYHTTRVLRVLALEHASVIVTGGEDCKLVFWCMDTGRVLRDINRNCGNNGIRSLSYHRSGVVCAGGWDGGINEFKVPRSSTYQRNYTVSDCTVISSDMFEESYPKWICCLTDDRYIFCLSSGRIYLKDNVNIHLLLDDPRLQEYSVVRKMHKNIVIGGKEGDICLLDVDIRQTKWITCKENVKVCSIVQANEEHMLISQAGGIATLWKFLSSWNIECSSRFVLRPSKNCWVTCASLIEEDGGFLLMGTRRGGVYIYADIFSGKLQHAIQCYHSLHGVHGTTQIGYHNNELVSVGNDGNIVVYGAHDSSFKIVRKYRPLSNIRLIQKLENIDGVSIVHYFYGKNYVIMNLDLREVLFNLNCGGIHRFWDTLYDGKLKVAYINTGKMYYVTSRLRLEHLKMYSPSSHGSEIHAAIMSTNGSVITGGEDGDITYRMGPAVNKYSSHISAVRSLTLCEPLLFSGGGKGILKAWNIGGDKLELVADYNVQTKVNSVVGYPKSNSFSGEKCDDQKITSLDSAFIDSQTIELLIGLSSGLILEVLFRRQCCKFAHSSQHDLNNCVTVVKHQGAIKLAATTFGFIHIIHPQMARYKCHNSAINGLDVRHCAVNAVSMATVGDNGDICVLSYDMLEGTFSVIFRKTAHFSAGIRILFSDNNSVLSVGSDQRMVLFDCTSTLPLNSCYMDVCDPHSLELNHTKNMGVVVGKGLQYFELRLINDRIKFKS